MRRPTRKAERLTGEAAALLQKAGANPEADERTIALANPESIASFIRSCRKLRLWSREMAVEF